ncbi:MAG: hypothetical protein AB7O79_15365 [Xanthobacteraceae bacterium]
MTMQRTFLAGAAIAAVLLALPGVAQANRAAADACAARLGPDAKIVYAAVIDSVKAGDLVETIKLKTRSLVMSGKLSRGQAKAAAEAAGACLKQAK